MWKKKKWEKNTYTLVKSKQWDILGRRQAFVYVEGDAPPCQNNDTRLHHYLSSGDDVLLLSTIIMITPPYCLLHYPLN